MQIFVRDNDVDYALRQLKRKLRREGLFRELKRRRAYEKPSERRAREKIESARRRRKALRKRLEREGYSTARSRRHHPFAALHHRGRNGHPNLDYSAVPPCLDSMGQPVALLSARSGA